MVAKEEIELGSLGISVILGALLIKVVDTPGLETRVAKELDADVGVLNMMLL